MVVGIRCNFGSGVGTHCFKDLLRVDFHLSLLLTLDWIDIEVHVGYLGRDMSYSFFLKIRLFN